MNKFIFSAIAIAAASSTSFASDTSEWLQLDQDIASLSSSVNVADGMTVGGLLRNSYRDGGTTGGWDFDDADIWFAGSLEEFDMRMSADVGSGSLVLEDAYVTWNCGNDLSIMWGQFSATGLRSSGIDGENLLFIDRSLLGSMTRVFDNGAAISGSTSGFGWALAAQNGSDSTGENLDFTGNVTYNLGNGVGMHEGAMKAGDDFDATIGLTYFERQDDGRSPDYYIDFAFTMGKLSGSFEAADLDLPTMDAPSSLTLGYLIADNMEIALRHEDKDTAADENKDTFGFNYYVHGHNAKWSVNYIDEESAADEIIAVGLTVGSSR